MQYVLKIFYVLIALAQIKCNVTNRSKNIELATRFYGEIETKNISSEELKERKFGPESEVENRVYLDDVLLALKKNNWTVEENPCLDQINVLLQSLQNFTLWAVWEWDTQSSQPQGLLFANRYQLGNFDQCMNAPWADTHPELKMKYCLADIVLERTDNAMRKRVGKPFSPYQSALDFMEVNANARGSASSHLTIEGTVITRTISVRCSLEFHRKNTKCIDLSQCLSGAELMCVRQPLISLVVKSKFTINPQYHPPHTRPLNELTWGTCVPDSCLPATVERLLAIMLARSHLGVAGIRPKIAVTEPCQTDEQQKEFDGLFYAFICFLGFLIAISLLCTYLNCRKNKLDPNNRKTDIIKAFCLKENATDLMNMKAEGIEVFYGIRFLTMCLIVLDHQIGIYNSGPISDGFTSDKDIQSPLGLLVLHDDLFVDTFFLLSGFLTVTNLIKMKKLPNPFLMIFKRYVRLVVAFAIVIFYVCAVYPYTGSGPLWQRAISADTEQCRKNWWLNLLMVNNYIDTENMCIVVFWYIPCDFHFFALTVILYWIYKHVPLVGIICAGVVSIASIILPGIINYMYQLSAVQLFTIEFVLNPRGSEDFHLTYIKSHTRYASYLVGFISGYIFVNYSTNDNLNRISKKWSILGTISALTLMLAVMVCGSTFLWRTYHPLEGAVYAAINRPAWACGVAALVLCCSFGHVPLVKSFLSWYPWVPLSRLAYGLYLTHTIIISRNVFVTRNPQHNDYFEIVNSAAGVIFWGCIAALFLWLLAEAPANKLLALCLKPKAQAIRKGEENKTSSHHTSVNPIPTGNYNYGYLQDNLPSTVYISSKF